MINKLSSFLWKKQLQRQKWCKTKTTQMVD